MSSCVQPGSVYNMSGRPGLAFKACSGGRQSSAPLLRAANVGPLSVSPGGSGSDEVMMCDRVKGEVSGQITLVQ